MTGATAADRVAASRAWVLMNELVRHVSDNKRDSAAELGLSFARTRALRRIAALGPMPMRELVAELDSDPPYVSVVVDDLAERGLVVREPHPQDRRVKLVSVTPEGRRVARRAQAILARPPAVLDRLTAAEQQQLVGLLERLVD